LEKINEHEEEKEFMNLKKLERIVDRGTVNEVFIEIANSDKNLVVRAHGNEWAVPLQTILKDERYALLAPRKIQLNDRDVARAYERAYKNLREASRELFRKRKTIKSLNAQIYSMAERMDAIIGKVYQESR
jgi:hypothetical protein